MSDRKYRHRGYQDSGSSSDDRSRSDAPRSEAPPRQQRIEGAPRGRTAGGFGPQAFKCSRCGEKQTLTEGVAQDSTCAGCSSDLHTCTNCQNFDTASHWQCRVWEQIPHRMAPKDVRNDCPIMSPRYVADLAADKTKAPTSPDDARKAFDALFKK